VCYASHGACDLRPGRGIDMCLCWELSLIQAIFSLLGVQVRLTGGEEIFLGVSICCCLKLGVVDVFSCVSMSSTHLSP
ncbi:hypothetical protein U9M48_005735, partial [Paspalum notatum var. saurae]